MSLGILLVGYCVSIVLGFRFGQHTETRLQYVSEALFTAATQSQIALTAFDQQIKLYNDAVILEDEDLLESAQEKATAAQRALQSIIALRKFDLASNNTPNDILYRLQDFTISARTVYAAMSSTPDLQGIEEINTQAARLAQQTRELQEDLASLTQARSAHLKQELSDIRALSKRARYIELSSFVVVVIVALIVTAIFIRQSILKPITQLAAIASKIAVGDLSGRIDLTSDDELGMVANAFRDMIVYIRNVAQVAQRLAVGEIQVHVELQSDQDVLNQAFAHTIQYIQELADVARKVAMGEIHVQVEPKSKQDVLNHAFADTIRYIQDVADVAQKVAAGNIQVRVTPQSKQDILNQTFADTIRYIQNVAGIAEKISQNDLDVAVQPQSKEDLLNISLQRMVLNLRKTQEKIEQTMAEVDRQNWIKTGQTELNNLMSGEQEPMMLAKNIITYIARYVGAQVGAIYLRQEGPEEPVLKLTASYAYTKRKGQHATFRFGESLIGQAALEKESIIYSNVPQNYTFISSGLGETIPHSILVVPFLYENEIKGVCELGSSDRFTRRQLEFLEQVAENIAITFHTAQARITMQDLLEKSQQQAEKLQSQQEELRQSNEELEERSKALQESEGRLQTQQEELRQTNEELSSQTRVLEKQKQTLEEQKQTLKEKNLALQRSQQIVEDKARELELTNKYKSEFLANMSHELRTPLNSLLILSNLLHENKEGNLTEKQREFARMIHAAGVDLVELIDDILDLSKIETGKMTINIQEVKMESLATYIEQHFTHVARQKALDFTVAPGEQLPMSIRTDRKRLEQIVKNFLSNAFKFTEQGGVSVVITRPEPEIDLSHSGLIHEQSIAISVSDTGIGLPAEKQEMIFEAFQQADGATTRKYGGTGLGLSISKKLAALLGGEIQVHSEAGQGSTFTLYLPEIARKPDMSGNKPTGATVVTDQEVSPSFPQPPAMEFSEPVDVSLAPTSALPEEWEEIDILAAEESHAEEISAIRDDRRSIEPGDKVLLIVEDDPQFAKVMFNQAHENYFKCLLAGDGEAGLLLAYQYKPHAIILDIMLPRMDGWAVMNKLQENLDTRYIPVHFISSQDHSQKAMRMGAIGYLTKPVTLDILNQAFTTIEHTLTNPFKKVLVIEDNDTMRASILELLNNDQTEIITTATGEEAYTLLKSETFDCMVLDLGLSDISGLALLERIKKDETIPQIPVIVYTGQELNREEEMKLASYTESIIIKGVKSQERLLDEVMLFLHRVESELPKDQQQKLRRIYGKETVLEEKKVLIVDDDMRNVYALSSVLEEHGMEVVMGINGAAALERLDEHPDVDLVLMDIMMPDMDGYEAIQAVRKQPRFQNLPIITLTAKAMRGDRQKCIEAGASDYLSKPVDTNKLLSLLRVWLY